MFSNFTKSRSIIYDTHLQNLHSTCVKLSVWSPPYRQDIEALEAVQRRFIKRLISQRNCSYGERLCNLSLLSLESQRIETDLITAYKLIHSMMGISTEEAGLALSISNTRGGGICLQQKFAASVSIASHFKFRAVAEWNFLPIDTICRPNLSSFKSDIRQWLLTADAAFFE